MDKCLANKACRAHRQEVRAERKEARLHNRAVNAALHGKLGKAIVLESRAGNQAARADRAHHREQAATTAMVNNMHHHQSGWVEPCHNRHHRPHHHSGCAPVVHVVHTTPTYGTPAGAVTYGAAYPQTGTTYTTAPVQYPVGQIPPQYPAPPAGAYPPMYAAPPAYAP